MKVTGDLRHFNRALKLVKEATRKDGAEIVNRALRDVAFRAMQFSAFAEPGKIQAELYRDNLALKIAAKKLSARRGTVRVDRFGNTKLTKSGRAKKFGSRVSRAQIAQYAAKLIQRRIKGSRAVRAGWIPALRAFGGQVRGSAQQRSGTSTARGFGKKATVQRLAGEISNSLVTRNHAGHRTPVEMIAMAQHALQRAVNFVAQDREQYARGKIEATLRKHSD